MDYEFKFPLEEELKYFINHLNGEPISVADGDSAIEVMEILDAASNELLRN